jgi:hypothetical protein
MNITNKQARGILVTMISFAITPWQTALAQEQSNKTPDHYQIHHKYALQKINIRSVDFEKLTLGEALQVLALKIEQESNEKIIPNFIVHDLKGVFKNKRVTLQLQNLPASVLLKYIANQVGASIRYDKHATIISPQRPPR